jgi:hypothetical protein
MAAGGDDGKKGFPGLKFFLQGISAILPPSSASRKLSQTARGFVGPQKNT